MKSYLILITLVLSYASVTQLANAASEGEKQELAASQACERIQNSTLWGQEFAQALKKKEFLSGFGTDPLRNLFFFSSMASEAAFRDNALRDNFRSAYFPTSDYATYVMRQTALRTFRLCGTTLHQNKKILLNNDKEQQANFLSRVDKCITGSEANFERQIRQIGSTKAQQESNIVSSQCSLDLNVPIPLHFIVEGGDSKFEQILKSEEYKKDLESIDKRIAEVTILKGDKIADDKKRDINEKEKLQSNTDKNNRLVEIGKGNLSTAKTCGEIAESLIPRQEIASNIFGYPVSKDSQAVYRTPNEKLYATVGRMVSYNTKQAITLDTNQLSGQSYAFVLNFSNKTIWFKDNVSVGKNLYFVGRYISNDSIPIETGKSKSSLPARVLNVICASVV